MNKLLLCIKKHCKRFRILKVVHKLRVLIKNYNLTRQVFKTTVYIKIVFSKQNEKVINTKVCKNVICIKYSFIRFNTKV